MLEIQHPLSHNYDGTECSTAQQDFVCLFSMTCRTNYPLFLVAITQRLRFLTKAVADPGGGRGGHGPPGPVKIGHKKDGCQSRSHRFHVSRPPLTRPLDPLLKGSK